MKIKIKNFNGELPSYLTVGRVYEVFKTMFDRYVIKDDVGLLAIKLQDCCYLNGGSWEIINEKHED